MPTASRYHEAETTLQGLARQYRDAVAWAPVNPAKEFVNDGPMSDMIDGTVAQALGAIASAAQRCDELARECRWRAQVCARFQRDLHAYYRLPLDVRAITPRPIHPYRWVAG